ncbi:MAG: glycosyltransferase family 2 protein [Armatimonadota bacterium]|nr:glycosyltransferase family 2 protein [bacterium]
MGISALVLTYNEEARIKRCLERLDFADEIVVVDSFSTDGTLDIVRRYTSNVSQNEFTGFSNQWNAAIERANEDWVLIIGADEVISRELATEITTAAREGNFDAYRMPRSTFFLGRRMRHCGWYPDYQLRLVRRIQAHIPDRLVHETLVVDGQIGTLRNPIVHYSYDTMADYCRKMVRYARAAAEQKHKEGREFHIIDLLLNPGHSFLKMYILQQGFRDGLHGFVLSSLTACSSLLRYAFLWEMSASKDQTNEK